MSSRLGGDQGSKQEDVDAVLQHHQNMQEKIADEMVKMAQSLKHTSMVASNIIKEDNKVCFITYIHSEWSSSSYF